MQFDTLLLHGRSAGSFADNATLPPIAQNTAFRYRSAEEHEQVFKHTKRGFAYTRIGNPTTASFEIRINELEGGAGAIATSSGMAAITNTVLNITCAGDEIIVANELYGGTLNLFSDIEKLGIKTHYVKEMTRDTVLPLINERTRLVFAEAVSNPSLHVVDIAEIASLTKEKKIPLVIDSTTATPFTLRPLELGADIVVHSTSKYINGGGNSIGGVIVDGGSFEWDFDRFTALKDFKKFGNMAFMVRLRTDLWENMGSCISPFNSYMNIVGIETLGLRMERINKNADRLAHALAEKGIDVNYLSLPGHPSHELYKTELHGNGGGILTFRAGSKERAFEILNSLKYVCIASNIGDVRTLVIHPASTIFLQTPEREREAAGVYDDTIRVSVGIENSDDLVEDFLQAIEK